MYVNTKNARGLKRQSKVLLTLLGSLCGLEPSPLLDVSGLFKTPTGTITLGVELLAPPCAATCWCGGIVEQYSIGLAKKICMKT